MKKNKIRQCLFNNATIKAFWKVGATIVRSTFQIVRPKVD